MPKNIFRRWTKYCLVISNIVVAVLFLLSCYGGYLNPVYFWFTGFLTLASFFLFAFLVLFLFFWLIVKPRRSLISFISIGLAFIPFRQVIPWRITSSFNKIKPDTVLRVMTWNVEHFDILEHKTHPEIKKQMLDLVNDFAPDIACFQEMVGSDTVPGAINYVPDIQKALGFNDAYYSYNRKIDFDGNHHFGIIIFSRLPVINKQTVSYPPHDYNSIFQYADIVRNTDTFRLFNIHLQSLKFSPSNLQYIDNPEMKNEEDIRQAEKLAGKFKVGFIKRMTQSERVAAEIRDSPYPVIVCGDFNDVPNSYAYLTIGKGLKNAFVQKGSGLGRTFSAITPTLRIDNIFTDPRMEVMQYGSVRKKMSDHFPVVTDLYFKKQ